MNAKNRTSGEAAAEPVPFAQPYFPGPMREAILADIDAVLAGGRLMLGPVVQRLEQSFAEMVGTRTAVALNSATTGLQIALRHAGARGRKVLVPAASFVTDVSAVLFEGGTPVLVDCDPETLALDPADLARKIDHDTSAVIWVHLTGYISEAHDQIRAVARSAGAVLIEDASHAHGAAIDSNRAGSLGDVGVFSLFPTKVMTAGTGGLLVTDDDGLAELARALRVFGKDPKSGEIVHLGNDWFMDEIRASVAVHQLGALPEMLARRREIAARYGEGLANLPGLTTLTPREGHLPSWYQYSVFLRPGVPHERVAKALADASVPSKRIYLPVHYETAFRAYAPVSGLAQAERMLERSLCLPMFAGMTDEQVQRVIDAVRDTMLSLLEPGRGPR